MDTKCQAVFDDIEKLIGAINDVVQALHTSKRILRKALRALHEGSNMVATLVATDAGETRQGANNVLRALESARHRSRPSVFAAGLDEGTTFRELARAWGFSRQLAAKYAKEVRGSS